MADSCFMPGCRNPATYGCSCDTIIKTCLDHINHHTISPGKHEIFIESTQSRERIKAAMATLGGVNMQTLNEGKEMFQDLCSKLCGLVDMFTKRQQCLIDLSSQKFTPDLEDRIKELEKVDIRFRKREEFQQLLDRHLSSEQDYMDYSHFQEFKVDFQNIALGLQQNNEYLQLVAQQTEQDKKERRKMKKKIEEIEQRLNLQDEGFRKHEVEIQDFCVEVDKCLKQTVSVEKMIRVESKKIKEITRVSAEGIKNEKRMMERMVQEKCQDLNAKIALVQQNENSFRERVQKIMDDIEQERVRREENEKKRAEEIAKKIAEDLEREAKLKRDLEEEELKKVHPEKRKVDAMNLNQKIEYLFDPHLKGCLVWNINQCKQYVKELIISKDGKYLFIYWGSAY